MEEAPEPTIIPTTDGYHHPFIQTYEPSVARIIEECSNNSGEKKIKLQREHIVVREYLNIIIKDQEVQWHGQAPHSSHTQKPHYKSSRAQSSIQKIGYNST